jgi:hemolysin D
MSSGLENTHLRVASRLLEIQLAPPARRSRVVLKGVCSLFLGLLIWAGVAKLDVVAVAPGMLVPQTYVKIVQPAEMGVVREILVKEGDRVNAGQILARLDATLNNADSHATEREAETQRLQLRRIEAELTDQSFARISQDDSSLFAHVQAQYISRRQAYLAAAAQEQAARDRAAQEMFAAIEQLKKLERTLPSYQKTSAAYKQLAERRLIGTLQAEEKEREALEKAQDLEAQRATVNSLAANVAQIEQRLAQVRSTYLSELNQERVEITTAITRLEQQSGKLNYQKGLLELRAPQAGVVKELATTTIGAVVQPGTVLVSLVPLDEPLVADVSIENADIGFVVPGQPVRVKVAAYQFQKYGMLEGTVKTVSADASAPADRELQAPGQASVFRARIEIKDQSLKVGETLLPLTAGMQLSAEILQGRRSVLEYLLSPVQRIVSEAATER